MIAAAITEALPDSVGAVGVFVNATPSYIMDICHQTGIGFVQMHGDEPAELLAELSSVPVIRAFRVTDGESTAVHQYLDKCQSLGCLPAAVLLDAFSPNSYGGTGKRVDIKTADRVKAAIGDLPLILAGGLNPENVADAIRTVQPQAVDTASGVESRPGVKSPALIQQFIATAREAFKNP